MGTGSFPGGKERPGRDGDPSPPFSAVVMKGQSYTFTHPSGRPACAEPQCLYKGALYLFIPEYADWLFTVSFHSVCGLARIVVCNAMAAGSV
jgi:hypothetical protein